MSGTTIIVAPAVGQSSSSAFARRSYSSPDLLSLPALEEPSSFGQSMSRSLLSLDSKGLSAASPFDIPSFNSDFELDTSLFLAGKSPAAAAAKPASSPVPPEALPAEPVTLPRARSATSLADRPRSWLAGFKSIREPQPEDQRRPATSTSESYFSDGHSRFPVQQSPTSESFATFAKRSWISPSRSPSPKNQPDLPAEPYLAHDATAGHGKTKRAITPRRLDTANQTDRNPAHDSAKPATKAFARASSYLAKIKSKPAKTSDSIGSNLSCASSATSISKPASTSIDTAASNAPSTETTATTPTTDDSSSEMPPRMLDPLWSSFKTLELEFKGFAAKAMPQKVGQIQSLVLPFLKSAMSQAPITDLRPEDVDRRATILNKWWGAFLDMLDGQYQQPVSGVDRPVLLEAATIIMMRPEWRQTTSYFLPLAERSPGERVRTRSCTNASDSSRSSNQSAMLAESAEHNVRTMFVSNLVKQMAFVVEKMSLRHAPLSLVNFAGKTCAYAFFFAPGVPDILVRLWGLTPDLIRRVSDELGLPRKDTGESDDIVALFPPKLGVFGWTSPRTMWDNLKHIPKMPMLVARIPWTGPWVARWKGRDTDLFFIFCKYFHLLSDQFMPSGLPLAEKARSPAFVLVHAQLLSMIDTTIHRQSALEVTHGAPLIDSMQGADASAHMSLPPTNLMKGMSENRLVMLLKDVLSDDTTKFAGARHTVAQAFAALLRGATRRTSRYDSTACFTLCDFLEEILIIYDDLETPDGSSYIDWPFWFDVCQKILTSLNTISEVRMLSFIFTIWDAVAKDPQRKLTLCRDWLLSAETFNSFFNNWCPMVRAYYQRLLCWRICRDKGSPNEVDLEIFLLATERLKMSWAHYLYLKQKAEDSGRAGPSTAPISPTLGKRFIIIRQEVNTPQPGLIMGFDSFAKLGNTDLIPGDGTSDDSPSKNDLKKRWSLLGKVLSFTSGQNSTADGSRHSMDDELQTARREIAESRSRPSGPAPPPKSTRSSNSFDSGRSSPVFDEQKCTFKFFLGWQQPPIVPRERVLVRPRLPTPAQARAGIRSRNGSPPPPAASSPAPMRSFSGSSHGGLVQAARNASPLSSPTSEQRRRTSVSFARPSDETVTMRSRSNTDSGTTSRTTSPIDERFPNAGIQFDANQERVVEPTTRPVKPAGIFEGNAIYSGRALAEWSLVVAECNNFVERRRDEGVLGLSEVEVPHLGVEGFRKIGG